MAIQKRSNALAKERGTVRLAADFDQVGLGAFSAFAICRPWLGPLCPAPICTGAGERAI